MILHKINNTDLLFIVGHSHISAIFQKSSNFIHKLFYGATLNKILIQGKGKKIKKLLAWEMISTSI